MKLFHKNNLVHGDFRAHNVLIDKDDNYKVVDYAALGLEYSQYVEFLNNKNIDCTLSPEELASLEIKESVPTYNKQQVDIFQTGLLMLQASTLGGCQKIYNWKTFEINFKELSAIISSLSTRYS